MSGSSGATIVNVGYRSTNFWVVSAGTSRLLVDLGWPGTMGTLRANLRRMDVPLSEIRYGLATHYHIDHAGLAQELKQAGVPLLVLDAQVEAIPEMRRWTKPQDRYVDITTHDNVTIAFDESRGVLEAIGIRGEVVHTPGHSDDSVSLVLDDGSAFTGDLTHPTMVGESDAEVVSASWQLLRDRGATRVYPGHGPARPMGLETTRGATRMDATTLRELGARYTAAWNEHDAAGVAAFHNESSFLKVNDGEPAAGRAAIADVAQGFMTAFPDMVLVMDSVHLAEGAVEYHWTFIGTNTGPDGSGNAVRFSGYEEWTLGDDGLIASSLGHFDEAEYNRQLEFGVDGS